MRFLFILDSFKGTLLSERVVQLLKAAAEQISPGCETAGVSVTDGREGVINVMIPALNGTYRRLTARGPLMEEVQFFYGGFEGDSAIIGIAIAPGLPTVPADRRDPLNATTYDTEESIKDALDRGYREISIAIGGSATNNGSMRAMRALGVRFLDDQGNELEGKGRDLARVADISVNRIHPAVSQSRSTVMCNVTNPLIGPDGATCIFGRQKGGTPETLDVLEGGMVRYAALLKEELGMDMGKVPGAGAVGGLGVALCVFSEASLKSDIDTVLDLAHLDGPLEGVDLVTTGEGRMDWQSAFGRVPSRIGKCCRERGIPVAVIVGGMDDKTKTISDYDIDSIITTINGAMDIEEALKWAEELHISAADHTFRVLKAGVSLGRK